MCFNGTSGIALVILVLAVTHVHCGPVRVERSAVWDFITNLSPVTRVVSDVIRETESPSPSGLVEPPGEESSSTYSPLEDIIFRIARFKRSAGQEQMGVLPEERPAYNCGGWGTPLPIPPPCRRS